MSMFGFGFAIPLIRDIISGGGGGGPSGDAYLLETGDYFLLETGDFMLLE